MAGTPEQLAVSNSCESINVCGTLYNLDLSRVGYARAALRTEPAEAAVCK
jgi:hypothetical protein